MNIRNAFVVALVSVFLAGCGGGGGGGACAQASFTYNPILGVPAEVNALGQLIGQQQRDVVTPGGDQSNPCYSAADQTTFDASNRLQQIVSNVTSSQTFQSGVVSIRTLSAATQATVFNAYSTPIDLTWAQTGTIGNGTTDAGQAVEREIATALTSAVETAVNAVKPPSVSFTAFGIPTPSSGPTYIATGLDRALWFTENLGNKIERITTSGTFTVYAVPTPNAGLNGITAGPDGALWFAETNGNKIGRISASGAITEYVVPTLAAGPQELVVGSDGAVWFSEYRANKIGRITAAGVPIEFPLPNAAGPWGITAGPDGALWFAGAADNSIGRITTLGAVTQYPIPQSGSDPNEITTGPDGALWFTQLPGNVGRISVAGAITIYPAAGYSGITVGPDGALWVTALGHGSIGQVTTSGVITYFNMWTARVKRSGYVDS